jgi:hypothetical protein
MPEIEDAGHDIEGFGAGMAIDVQDILVSQGKVLRAPVSDDAITLGREV